MVMRLGVLGNAQRPHHQLPRDKRQLLATIVVVGVPPRRRRGARSDIYRWRKKQRRQCCDRRHDVITVADGGHVVT